MGKDERDWDDVCLSVLARITQAQEALSHDYLIAEKAGGSLQKFRYLSAKVAQLLDLLLREIYLYRGDEK